MEEIVLQAKTRKVVGKQVRALRRAGLLPGVIYGTHIEPITITLNHHDASRILPTMSTSQLIEIEVEGERHTTLVREKQRHPVSGSIIHVDFQAVSLTEKLRVMVSLVLKGEAPAVKVYNGVVVTGQEEVEVECLPGNLPDHIEVDMTVLTELGKAIYVRDLNVPEGVEVLADPGELVVVIVAPAAEPEEEAALAGAAEPEVIERGKKEEEKF
jgi:large subunit ribosomal protein L25